MQDKKELYRFRIWKEKGNERIFFDDDVYIAPKSDLFPDGSIPEDATVWSCAYDDLLTKEYILLFSYDRKLISEYVRGFWFCIKAAKEWDNYFRIPEVKEETAFVNEGNPNVEEAPF